MLVFACSPVVVSEHVPTPPPCSRERERGGEVWVGGERKRQRHSSLILGACNILAFAANERRPW